MSIYKRGYEDRILFKLKLKYHIVFLKKSRSFYTLPYYWFLITIFLRPNLHPSVSYRTSNIELRVQMSYPRKVIDLLFTKLD